MTTILLADDNDDSRDIYRTLLEYEGYRVIEAHNGRVALDLLEVEVPDLIMLNLVMPLVDGHGVLEEMRARPHMEEIPCLVFTGDARFEQMGKSVHSGADAFLTKPAEPRAVLGLVEQLLGERREGSEAGG
jgi:CRP/FNR family transcriptional regulator, cyclic AMP receptor protein